MLNRHFGKLVITNSYLTNKITIFQILEHADSTFSVYRDILIFQVMILIKSLDERVFTGGKKDWPVLNASMNDLPEIIENVLKTFHKVNEFRLTRIGNWLIENNKVFRKEFEGTRVRKSYRLHSKRTYIKHRLEDLVEIDLIIDAGTIQSEKNKTDTDLYKCSIPGFIIGATLCLDNPDKNIKNISMILLCIFWFYQLIRFDRSAFAILRDMMIPLGIREAARLYKKLATEMISCLYEGNYDILLEAILFSKANDKAFHEGILRILSIRSPDDRKLIYIDLKQYVESKFGGMAFIATKEWEILRQKNFDNYSMVTVAAVCSKCEQSFPLSFSLDEYLEMPMKDKSEFLCYQPVNCIKCKSKGTGTIVFKVVFKESDIHYHLGPKGSGF